MQAVNIKRFKDVSLALRGRNDRDERMSCLQQPISAKCNRWTDMYTNRHANRQTHKQTETYILVLQMGASGHSY